MKLFSQYKIDLALYGIILAHIAVTYAVNVGMDSPQSFDITDTFFIFMLMVVCYGLVLATLVCIRFTLNALHGGKKYEALSPNNLTGIPLFLAIGLMIGSYRDFKKMMPEISPFSWDTAFANLDKAIHGADPWQYLSALDVFYEPMALVYSQLWHPIHTVITLIICVCAFKVRGQYLLTYVSSWIIAGNIMPLFFMAGGPIFYERLTGNQRFVELSDALNAKARVNASGLNLYDQLWQAYLVPSDFIGGGISAFPSLHVAISTLLFLTARSFGRIPTLTALAFLIFTLIGSVNLGWHYAVDGYASLLIVWGLWVFWGRVTTTAPKEKPLAVQAAFPNLNPT